MLSVLNNANYKIEQNVPHKKIAQHKKAVYVYRMNLLAYMFPLLALD